MATTLTKDQQVARMIATYLMQSDLGEKKEDDNRENKVPFDVILKIALIPIFIDQSKSEEIFLDVLAGKRPDMTGKVRGLLQSYLHKQKDFSHLPATDVLDLEVLKTQLLNKMPDLQTRLERLDEALAKQTIAASKTPNDTLTNDRRVVRLVFAAFDPNPSPQSLEKFKECLTEASRVNKGRAGEIVKFLVGKRDTLEGTTAKAGLAAVLDHVKLEYAKLSVDYDDIYSAPLLKEKLVSQIPDLDQRLEKVDTFLKHRHLPAEPVQPVRDGLSLADIAELLSTQLVKGSEAYNGLMEKVREKFNAKKPASDANVLALKELTENPELVALLELSPPLQKLYEKMVAQQAR